MSHEPINSTTRAGRNAGMQADDSRVCEAGDAGESSETEGTSPIPLRLSQDLHERHAEVVAPGVCAVPVRGEDPLAPGDVCYPGAFDFVSDALEAVDESFTYALNDIESTIEDIETSLAPHVFPICFSLIKSFVGGDKTGLVRLKKVYPAVFKTFSVSSPYDGLVDFVSRVFESVDGRVIASSLSFALDDIERVIDDVETSITPHIFPVSVSLIKSFVRGGRVGLVRLKKVLSNIFLSFPTPSPQNVLIECGLIPESSHDYNGFPSFILQPDLDGCLMIDYPDPANTRKRKYNAAFAKSNPSPSSEQLQRAYEGVRSTWTSPAPNESNS